MLENMHENKAHSFLILISYITMCLSVYEVTLWNRFDHQNKRYLILFSFHKTQGSQLFSFVKRCIFL